MARPMEKELSPLVGKPVDTEEIGQNMMDIIDMGRFSNSTYSMVEKNGEQGLQIQVERKGYAPPLVRPLILIDGSEYNNVLFSLGARITFLDVGSYRSELRNDVVLGSQYLLASEYYHPITTTSNWSIATRIGLNSQPLNIFDGEDLQASYRLRQALGGIDAGYAFGRIAEIRLGYEAGFEKASPQVGKIATLPTTSGATGDARIQFQLNTLDNPVIPRSGYSLFMYTKGYSMNPAAPSAFPLSEISAQRFFRINPPTSVFISASAGCSYGYRTGVPVFSLGGSQRLVAWSSNQLFTNQYFWDKLATFAS